MISQAQAGVPLPGVLGLAFLGFPAPYCEDAIHHTGRAPCQLHAADAVLQGARDPLADRLLVVRTLGNKVVLRLCPGADHSFHVPARSRQMDDQGTILDANSHTSRGNERVGTQDFRVYVGAHGCLAPAAGQHRCL